MNKIYIMKGLPGSGKTSKALEMLEHCDGKITRINKDDLREMFHDGKWSKNNEKLVIDARDCLIDAALTRGSDVIVDDTNLAPTHEKTIREKFGDRSEIVIIDMTNISPEECIARDTARSKSVGSKVIYDMYYRYLYVPNYVDYIHGLGSCVIVDIDGTLAEKWDRNPYDWGSVQNDTCYQDVASVVRTLSKDNKIIIFSGRDSVCRTQTEQWLDDNEVPYDILHMRAEGNKEKDTVIKERMFRENIEGKYNVTCILDDRKQVVDMWRKLGLRCLQVAEGNF